MLDFQRIIFEGNFKFPLITIYADPSDYPGKYVARLFDMSTPTTYISIADTMDEIRSTIPRTMIRLSRQPNDDPCIVEVWI